MSGAEPQRPSYDELALLVVAQAAKIVELEARIAELTSEVVELRRRLGADSSVFDAAARAGLPAITADIVRETLSGGAATAPIRDEVTTGIDDDVDDLLLA